jgi:hypothetical protein
MSMPSNTAILRPMVEMLCASPAIWRISAWRRPCQATLARHSHGFPTHLSQFSSPNRHPLTLPEAKAAR